MNFWGAFWAILLGATLFVAAVSTLYYLLVKKSPEGAFPLNQTIPKPPSAGEITKRLIRSIEKRRDEILACALEKSLPDIKRLEEQTQRRFEAELSKILDQYFKRIEKERVDRFLDKYYSLLTDYLVIYYRAKEVAKRLKTYIGCYLEGDLKVCLQREIEPRAEDYLTKLFEEYLLSEEDLKGFLKEKVLPLEERELKNFLKGVGEIILSHYREELKREIQKEVSNLKVDPAVVEEVYKTLEGDFSKQLGKLTLSGYAKALTSVGIGTAVAWVTFKKFSAKLAAKIAQKVAVKLAEKLAVKFASAIGAFGSGVGVCMEMPLVAPICGAVAGAIAWVASDFVVNKIDEALHRGETKREIVQLLEDYKVRLFHLLVEDFREKLLKLEGEIIEPLKGKIKVKNLRC